MTKSSTPSDAAALDPGRSQLRAKITVELVVGSTVTGRASKRVKITEVIQPFGTPAAEQHLVQLLRQASASGRDALINKLKADRAKRK